MDASDMMSEELTDSSPDKKEDSTGSLELLAKKLKVDPEVLREAIMEVCHEVME